MEAFKVGGIPGILSCEVPLRRIHIYWTFVIFFYGFVFLKHTLKDALSNLVPNEIGSLSNFNFRKITKWILRRLPLDLHALGTSESPIKRFTAAV